MHFCFFLSSVFTDRTVLWMIILKHFNNNYTLLYHVQRAFQIHYLIGLYNCEKERISNISVLSNMDTETWVTVAG